MSGPLAANPKRVVLLVIGVRWRPERSAGASGRS